MATTLQKKPSGVVTPATPQLKRLNAESVTAIATGFLKRIGHKGGLKPKKVSLEEEIYIVEVETKKFTAIIRVDAENQEITSYEIQPKGEETSLVSVSPKTVMIIVVIAAAMHVVLHFAFKFLGL
ncbi:MAG: hypothetical protein NZ932_00810 [Candidatus Bathyarchaeota archaeon]|nr:hypothetical protein [Candidatus Bathyarchaeota archaeon]MDW8040180.1 hypothetical protein [Nitrososphaerota archaeon]